MRIMVGSLGLGAVGSAAIGWRALCAFGIAVFVGSLWQMLAAIGAARIDVLGLPYPGDEAVVARWSALAGLGVLAAVIGGIRI